MATKKVKLKKDKPDTNESVVKSTNLFPVVGIGASAGGLNAFKKLLKAIPENSGMAYVLVQHLDPNHESLLPEILQKITTIPVVVITDDIKVEPNHIYIIPSNKMMIANDGVLELSPRPQKNKNERNLPIDLFFKSLSEVYQSHAIGVVLSGTASDGTLGLKAIKNQGGITFAQDEASAEYESMPNSAAEAGVVDFILPPEEIPKKLLEVTNKTILSDEELQNIPKQDEDVFKQILSLLRIRKGVDFTYYKQTTIRRRILRRMVVNKNEEPNDYLKFLRGNNQEQDLLYQDMLIPVTSFFRDKKTFENLCNNVFPAIVKNKIPGEITRIWVAGCSTGQEVYSFAICFKEFLGDSHERIQIFGTDLSEPAIMKARSGMYEKSEVDTVSPQRLKEYFTKNNGGYQVNKNIRDMCVFAHHNFLKDPPFGKMDVITCRNVLIYMETYLQKKALTTFHYALNPKGFLLLGKSETTGGVPDLFAAVEKNDKLYTRKDVPGRFMQIASQRSEQILNRPADSIKSDSDSYRNRTDFQKTADDILLTKYTPAGVVVNETMDIVHFRGNTAHYLEQAPGKPSHNLLMMAKNGLGFELRNILHKAKTDKVPVIKENIPLSVNGNLRTISIEAVPLPNTLEPYYLILFHDNNVADTDGLAVSNRKKVSAKTKKEEKDIQIQLLEQELAQAREDMRSITEDQEASNEELQSANEELLSGSEELQSLNEELETSKEELQSTNEELTVLNHELVSLNEQVTDARNYSESIVATLYQPLLVLDKNLRVKTANKAFYKTFKVNEEETEGVLIYDLGNRQWNIPELRTLLEEILPQKTSITNFEVIHNFSSIGIRTILLSALEITREKKEEKLILLSIEDITAKKEIEEVLIANTIRFRQMVKELPAPVYSCDTEGLITFYNEAAARLWGRHPLIGKDRWCGSWKMYKVDGSPLLAENSPMAIAFKTGHPIVGEEIIIERPNGTRSNVFVYPQPELNLLGEKIGVINIGFDVTEQVLTRKKMEESEQRFRSLVEKSPYPIGIFKGTQMTLELANEPMLKIFNANAEALGKPFLEILPEMKEQPFIALLSDVLQNGVTHYGTEQPAYFMRQNGEKEIYYFNFVYQPYHENDGSVSGVMVLATNVTEQVLARKKVEESELKYRSLFETMDQGFCIIEVLFDKANKPVDYLFVEVNPVFEEQTGLKNAAGKTILEIVPDLEKHWMDIYGKVVTTGESIRFIEGSDVMGRIFDVYAFKAGEPDSPRVAILFTDITKRKRAEKNLVESEERFRSLVMATSDTVYKMSADWKVMYNLEGKDFLADTPDSNISWLEKYIPDAERPLVIKTIEEAIAQKKIFELEHKVFDADGKIAFTYSRAVPKLNEAGEIIEWTGAASNITERKRAEQTLTESEAFNRAVFDSSPDCIKMLDAEGRLQFMNTNGICLLELDSFKEIENTYWWDMWEPHNRQIIKDAVAKAKSGEKMQLQLFGPTAKGTPKWWDIIILPVHEDGADKNLHRILSVSRDITQQKLTELKERELLTRFQNLVLQAPVSICVLRGKEYVIETINAGMVEMWGKKAEDVLNKPAFTVLPELVEQGFKNLLDHVYNTGERFITPELPINLQRHGQLENAYVKFVYEPLREADGTISGVMALAHEITEQVLSRKKTEESETKFRTLIADAPVATCLFTGREMIIEIANELMISYWGKGKNIIGKKLADVVPELKGQPFLDILDDVFTTGKIYEAKNSAAELKLNGVLDTYYFDYTYKPILHASGEVYGIMNMAVDVTEQVLARKKVEESETYFRQLADLMPAKISNADTEGNVLYFNKHWLDFTGLNFDDIKDFGYYKIMHPDEIEQFKERFQKASATGTDLEMEMRFRNKDGEYKWHLNLASPVKDENGTIKMWVGATTEIQKIKEDEQLKGDFLKMVSHELKTPVTSIKGYVQLLLLMLKEQEVTPSSFFETPLLRIDSQIKRLSRLISEMLDLSRLETGKLELQKELFSLDELLTETVQDIKFTNTNHTINISGHFTSMVHGDKDRIEQVIINLINNAIKYSPENNLVEVNLQATENNQVAVSIKDYGIGIDEQHQQKIFNRFYRAGGQSEENYAGFGIGLFIAKEIIERHNGSIKIDSEKGKGSVFTFTLPLATENENK